ncbi:unnamed protein product [Closterium sp. Yama58-4]|nr:unnamed protein product [Closterium sp. Yama58-4]
MAASSRQQWMRCVRSLGVVISNTGSRPVVNHSRPLTSLADAPARHGLPSMLGAFSARSTGMAAEIRARNAAQGFRSISVDALKPSDTFPRRHNSITPPEAQAMAEFCGFESVDALVTATVPKDIRRQPMQLGKYTEGFPENEMLERFKDMASKNKVLKSFIGMGYHGTIVPPVILRNLLENPGWYTQYTPYQAEIAQGRLESLLNFQTLITDLTAMPMSNASLLDEGTAAAEAMAMCLNISRGKKTKFYISNLCHPQTIDVCLTRADGLGIEAIVGDHTKFDYSKKDVCGVLVQYPATDGTLIDYSDFVVKAHENGAKVVMATDLLALTVVRPPGELGADMVVGSAQRFGVPMGYGGPHAAFLATSAEYKRLMPGRIIGVSIDAQGNPALRMAMQTREQHIRRDKATSNICTAQALLANMAAMYAVYHGPAGLKDIANRVHGLAAVFAKGVEMAGAGTVAKEPFFDTVKVTVGGGKAADVAAAAVKEGMNLRVLDADTITVAFDETSTIADVDALLKVVAGKQPAFTAESIAPQVDAALPKSLERESAFLTHPIFNAYHSEHELLRYLHRLQAKDLSLVHSMIALGSCTMKLNATAEMIPITWPELANIHPFAPLDQTNGYQEMFNDLGAMLAEITGFDSVSLQPNAGAAGEYAGLMAIRAYHQSRGDHHRNVCIIPVSAHGTNPASAAMCGMKIVAVGTDDKGNVNIAELKAAAEKHKDDLAALMITYPSTHGVYEEGVDEICRIIHANGGQVYMDGANMNAQVGLTSPGHIGADVCHLNLHKTFCIPHGGGGPGMGPIGVKAHLAPFLPSHPVVPTGGIPPPPPGSVGKQMGAIAAAPWGSALILPISFMYIAMMGAQGLTDASRLAILNANYMAKRLENHYPVLFRGANGTCAHEFIIDLRGFKGTAHIEPEDVAKRLMDYGFHAPTMSWPVPGTLMIEPTESESKAELDRFCDAMIAIREEIRAIEEGRADKANNTLKNAPHPASVVIADEWTKPYPREQAAFPAPWVRAAKFWPTTGRIDNVYGDPLLAAAGVSAAVVSAAIKQYPLLAALGHSSGFTTSLVNMFWRVAGLAATSPVDLILDRDQYTLEELLDEDDLIQECKSLNNRLVNFLKGKPQVEKMIRYVVEAPPDDGDAKRTFKFPFISCEVFTCDIDQILTTVVEEEEIMDLLFSFTNPDRSHSNLLAGYFSKVAVSLLIRKTPEVMSYLQRHPEVLDNLIRLIGITSVMEVVMKLVGADDQIMMYHSDKLEWLAETSLLDTLLSQLSAQSSSDVHANAAECLSAIARTAPSALAAQLSTPKYIGKFFEHVLEGPRSMTSVINSLSVCITLLDPKRAPPPGVMRNQLQYQLQTQQYQQQQQVISVETVEGMVQRLGELIGILDLSNDDKVLPTTYGELRPPLGIHRLKIVEFIGVLLGTNSELVRQELVRLGGVRTCLDLFFRFHFNNFLHHHVERMVMAILESGSSLLLEHLFVECDILNRIMTAYDDPHAPDSRPEPRSASARVPARSGYMGHLTRIANRICQLAASNSQIEAHVQANPRWADWQKNVLRKRLLLENVYQWSCGRPAALDDRPGDSDDDEFNSRDRDFDISTISLTGGSNANRSYQYAYGQSLLDSDDVEEGHELRDPYDVDLVKAEQEIETLALTENAPTSGASELLPTPAAEEPDKPLSSDKPEGEDAADEEEEEGSEQTGTDESGFKPLLLDGPSSLFTSSEAAQTAWVAFQEEQQQMAAVGDGGENMAGLAEAAAEGAAEGISKDAAAGEGEVAVVAAAAVDEASEVTRSSESSGAVAVTDTDVAATNTDKSSGVDAAEIIEGSVSVEAVTQELSVESGSTQQAVDVFENSPVVAASMPEAITEETSAAQSDNVATAPLTDASTGTPTDTTLEAGQQDSQGGSSEGQSGAEADSSGVAAVAAVVSTSGNASFEVQPGSANSEASAADSESAQ